MDRRCVRPCLRRLVARVREPGRPCRAQANVHRGADRLRLRIRVGSVLRIGVGADCSAGQHGHRGRAHDAVDALHHHRSLPRRRRAPTRHRLLGRHERCRIRSRPDHRWPAPLALLVGIGIPHQRPHCGAGGVLCHSPRAGLEESTRITPRPHWRRAVHRRRGARAVVDHRGTFARVVLLCGRGPGSHGPRDHRWIHRLGAHEHPPDARPRVLPKAKLLRGRVLHGSRRVRPPGHALHPHPVPSVRARVLRPRGRCQDVAHRGDVGGRRARLVAAHRGLSG